MSKRLPADSSIPSNISSRPCQNPLGLKRKSPLKKLTGKPRISQKSTYRQLSLLETVHLRDTREPLKKKGYPSTESRVISKATSCNSGLCPSSQLKGCRVLRRDSATPERSTDGAVNIMLHQKNEERKEINLSSEEKKSTVDEPSQHCGLRQDSVTPERTVYVTTTSVQHENKISTLSSEREKTTPSNHTHLLSHPNTDSLEQTRPSKKLVIKRKRALQYNERSKRNLSAGETLKRDAPERTGCIPCPITITSKYKGKRDRAGSAVNTHSSLNPKNITLKDPDNSHIPSEGRNPIFNPMEMALKGPDLKGLDEDCVYSSDSSNPMEIDNSGDEVKRGSDSIASERKECGPCFSNALEVPPGDRVESDSYTIRKPLGDKIEEDTVFTDEAKCTCELLSENKDNDRAKRVEYILGEGNDCDISSGTILTISTPEDKTEGDNNGAVSSEGTENICNAIEIPPEDNTEEDGDCDTSHHYQSVKDPNEEEDDDDEAEGEIFGPSTPQQKEARHLARIKQLREMKARDAAESRQARALRRSGGVIPSPRKSIKASSKKISWKEERHLVSVFNYIYETGD